MEGMQFSSEENFELWSFEFKKQQHVLDQLCHPNARNDRFPFVFGRYMAVHVQNLI